MELLVDTHAFIWFVEDDSRLSVKALRTIENPTNRVYLSIASIWEMAIKMQLKKLDINKSVEEVIDLATANGFKLLPILPEHIIKLSSLKFYHRDPFDRMIIAQAIEENQNIVTKDKAFDDYPVERTW